MESLTHIEALSRLAQAGNPFVVVTMVETQGSTPQDAGTKMLVDDSGRVHGTVGGGKVEHRAIEHAGRLLNNSSKNREVVDWNLNRDVGMTCGGTVKLLFEVYNRDNWQIVIFGAGHVAQALVIVLQNLNCTVTCIDTRQEWLDRMPDFRCLQKVCTEDLQVEAAKIKPTDFVVCMTMGHSTDRPILATIFKHKLKPAYLGVIGSRTKRGALLRELKTEDGIEPETADSFVCPIGLPFGSNQPAEIAISIVAQLLQYRDQAATDNQLSTPVAKPNHVVSQRSD